MSKKETIASHLKQKLGIFYIGIPVLVSVLTSIFVIGLCLWIQQRDARLTIDSIKAHLATFVETQDRPEIERLLKSVQKNRDWAFKVIQNGVVIGSTGSVDELDREFLAPAQKRLFGPLFIDGTNLNIYEKVQRANGPETGAELLLVMPFWGAIKLSLWIGLGVLLLGLGIGNLYNWAMSRALRKALSPLGKLNEEIRNIAQMDGVKEIEPMGISELDSIRQNVLETQRELDGIKNELAEERARQKATDRMRILAHELETPVAVLKLMTKAVKENPDNEELKEQAIAQFPKISEHILGQISAAGKMGDFDEPRFNDEDLREGIVEAKELMEQILGEGGVKLTFELPEEKVSLKHDKVLITRALTNLLKNAIEAGSKNIEVSLKASEKGEIVISIGDDGKGMTESDAHIFLFGRGRSTKRNRFALGLASVNKIVSRHQGKINFRQSRMGGASFELVFQKGIATQGFNVRGIEVHA